jgi:hypothetical protein
MIVDSLLVGLHFWRDSLARLGAERQQFPWKIQKPEAQSKPSGGVGLAQRGKSLVSMFRPANPFDQQPTSNDRAP